MGARLAPVRILHGRSGMHLFECRPGSQRSIRRCPFCRIADVHGYRSRKTRTAVRSKLALPHHAVTLNLLRSRIETNIRNSCALVKAFVHKAHMGVMDIRLEISAALAAQQ